MEPMSAEVLTEDETEWLLLCKYCGRTFEDMSSLRTHKQKVHVDGKIKPIVKHEVWSEVKVETDLSSSRPGNSSRMPINLDQGKTWYKCSTCQRLVNGPIKFVLHQHQHHRPIPQLFHTENGSILEINQLPNLYEIFVPKIELRPLEEVCSESKFDTTPLDVRLPKLTDAEIHEAIAAASKIRLRTRGKKLRYNLLADEDEFKYPNDDKDMDADWSGSESESSKEPAVTIKEFCVRKQEIRRSNIRKGNLTEYSCALCTSPYTYPNLRHYTVHLRKFHLKDETFHCPFCPFTDATPLTFHEHMLLHEPVAPNRNIMCRLCSGNLTFATNFLYTNHMMKNHRLDGKTFKCPHCPRIKLNKLFRFEKHMQKHDRLGTSSDIYYKSSYQAKKRRSKASRERWKCTLCEKDFEWKSDLDKHVEAHQRLIEKNASKAFKCKHCDAAFASNNNLKRHGKTHLDGDALVCKFRDCGTRASTKYHLERHMQRHFLKPLACPLCKRQCSIRETLDRHIKNFHTAEGQAMLRTRRGRSTQYRVRRIVPDVLIPEDLVKKYSGLVGPSICQGPAGTTNTLSEYSVLTSNSKDSSKVKQEEQEGRMELDSIHLGDPETLKKECAEALNDVNQELENIDSMKGLVPEEQDSISNCPAIDMDIGSARLRRQALQNNPLLKRLAPEFTEFITGVGYTTGGVAETFACNLCTPPKYYQRTYFLNRHKLKEHPEETAKESSEVMSANSVLSFTCGACGLQCGDSDDLAQHINIAHTKERKFHCSTCGIKFKSQIRMEEHVALIHNSEQAFKCDSCPKSFATAKRLRYHKNRLHTLHTTDPQSLTCKHCGKLLRYPWSLQTHLKLHAKDRKLSVCKMCGDKFSCPVSLRRHISLVHLQEKERLVEAKRICDGIPESDLFL